MKKIAFIGLLLFVVACISPEPEADTGDTWVGTVTTEGNVTTVVNESGSVWAGTATLVEDASIGVESGAEEYLFGTIMGLGVAGDRIYVLDSQALLVRVYDSVDGRHLMDFGGEGDGPGEFRGPTGLAVGPESVFVRDPRLGRISVFSLEGELLDTWPTRPLFTGVPIVATTGGDLFVLDRRAMVAHGPDGASGVGIPLPQVEDRPPMMSLTLSKAIPGYSAGAMLARRVPFWPMPAFALSPNGEMIHGAADRYRFVIERRSDNTVTEIALDHEPIPVAAAEAEWHRARVTAYMRQADAAWQWDAPEIPAVKPAYSEFVPAVSEEVWVLRPGPGFEDSDCDPESPMDEAPESCWKDARIVDVFGVDGRLLGRVDVPREFRFQPRPFIRGETVVGVLQDDAGTIMVKRYRLVLPGKGS